MGNRDKLICRTNDKTINFGLKLEGIRINRAMKNSQVCPLIICCIVSNR